MNVLVVDDTRDVADSVAELLRLFGHTVRVAYGGEEALSEIASWKPDAMLIDINMPVLDGIAVAHRVRESRTPGVRLVAHTAFARPTIIRNVEEAGFDAFIPKSASPLALALAIQGGPGEHNLRTGRRERRMVSRSRSAERRTTRVQPRRRAELSR